MSNFICRNPLAEDNRMFNSIEASLDISRRYFKYSLYAPYDVSCKF